MGVICLRENALLNVIRGGDCTVLGYGVSNRPLVEWLISHGAKSVTVRDQRDTTAMEACGDAARLSGLGVNLIAGEGYLSGLAGDVIFRSPGIRPDLPEITAALKGGSVLSSEMELFLSLTEAQVYAVSGSDGKTTTTTLTSLMLTEAVKRLGKGRVYKGGNIGTPLLPFVEEMTPDDIAVVELSSFQLMSMQSGAEITRGALTNITPNHLNWHTSMAEYAAAKEYLVSRAGVKGIVLNARDTACREIGERVAAPVIWFTGERNLPGGYLPDTVHAERGDMAVYEADGVITLVRPAESGAVQIPLMDTSRIRLPGRHNVENFMTAVALTYGAVTPEDIGRVADDFTGVAHRLELIAERDGIRYYNSSIDSSPTRTEAALSAMREMNERLSRRDPIVIVGGRGKGVPFDTLADALCRMASAVVLTGETREAVMAALSACPLYDPDSLPVTVIPDYREAMVAACQMATAGDTLLLSPAATSFDAFRNFEERGEVFRKIVADYVTK